MCSGQRDGGFHLRLDFRRNNMDIGARLRQQPDLGRRLSASTDNQNLAPGDLVKGREHIKLASQLVGVLAIYRMSVHCARSATS